MPSLTFRLLYSIPLPHKLKIESDTRTNDVHSSLRFSILLYFFIQTHTNTYKRLKWNKCMNE